MMPDTKYFWIKGVEDRHRYRRHHDGGVLQQVAQLLLFKLFGHVHGHARRIVLDQDVLQHQLQGVQLVVVEVDQGVEKAVPVAHRVEQDVDGDDGRGQRDGDLEQELEIVAAVDAGALQQLAGDVDWK